MLTKLFRDFPCCILGIRHAVRSKVQGMVKVRQFKKVRNLNSTPILICNPGEAHGARGEADQAALGDEGGAGGRDAPLPPGGRGSTSARSKLNSKLKKSILKIKSIRSSKLNILAAKIKSFSSQN